MLIEPGLIEIYLLLLSFAGFAGCALLCQDAWRRRQYVSLVAWNLAVIAWGWLAAGELLWNVVGWSEWVTRLPRATVFRVFMVGAIWLLVFEHRRRRRKRPWTT